MYATTERTLTVSPRQLAMLYHRCIRCLYERVHAGDETELPGSAFRPTAVAALEEARDAAGSIEIPGNEGVRIVSQELHPASDPIPFPDFGLGLVFRAHPATVLDCAGTAILCTHREREENAAVRSVLRCSLEASAFAAEHSSADLPHVDELGIVEFSLKLVPGRRGMSKRVYKPVRLIRMRREPERFAMFLRVVARILAGRKPPPAGADCPHCSGGRAGDRVPA